MKKLLSVLLCITLLVGVISPVASFSVSASTIDQITVGQIWNGSWSSDVTMKNVYLTVDQTGYYNLNITDHYVTSELQFRLRDFDAVDTEKNYWYNTELYGYTENGSYTGEKIYLIEDHMYELSLVYGTHEYDDYYDEYIDTFYDANISVLFTKTNYTPIKLTLGSYKTLTMDYESLDWLEFKTTTAGDYLFQFNQLFGTNEGRLTTLSIYEKESGGLVRTLSSWYDTSTGRVQLKANTEYILKLSGAVYNAMLIKFKVSKAPYDVSKIEISDQNSITILPDDGYIYSDGESSFYWSDIRSLYYKVTFSNNLTETYDYYDLFDIGIEIDDIIYDGKVYSYDDENFFKQGRQPVTIEYNGSMKSASYIYITSYVEWNSNLRPIRNDGYGTIEYEGDEWETYYWRIIPDENNMYAFYSYSWDELAGSYFTIFDENGNIVPQTDGAWSLKGGKEYCLRISYIYDDYCYDDIDFYLEPDRDHSHSYSNRCDEYCNTCEYKRAVTHNFTKRTVVKATTSRNGYILTECSLCGKDKSKSTIYYPKNISLSGVNYAYSGKVITPKVVVKNSAGQTISSKYYTVTYARGRKNVGRYAVTIKFKGNYSGSKTLYFNILPPRTTVSKLTAGKKSFTATITKKSAQVTGYQLQYSTNKKFSGAKTQTIRSYKTTKQTIKNLYAKKYYYVRVRTYKTVGGKNYYSSWSNYKYIKTK